MIELSKTAGDLIDAMTDRGASCDTVCGLMLFLEEDEAKYRKLLDWINAHEEADPCDICDYVDELI